MRKESAILVIDDEPGTRASLVRSLGNAGFRIVQAASGEHGLWAIEQHQFSCVLAEFRLPDIDGHVFVQKCHRMAPTLPVIVISGPEDSMDAAQCLREGAVSWLSKPFSPSNACVIVCQAIEKNALKAKCRAAGQIRTS